jgi:23S rRNA (adenine2503-C2)-methyltransferase
MPSKVNLLNLSFPRLRDWLAASGQPAYRAEQIVQWIYQRGLTDFSQMTNLSRSFRQYLQSHACLAYPTIKARQQSKDGTQKWLFQLQDGHVIESVYIPEKNRGTLCISSQVGCPLKCTFCATGQLGFVRNLELFEIVGQVYSLIHQLCPKDYKKHSKVTNIVFMGMGEPLLNLSNVVDTIELLMSDFSYGFSKYRVTVSTIGLLEPLKKLKERSSCSLAISLHAPTDALRHQLMPATQAYSLSALIDICKHHFPKSSKRKITFEYVLIKGINDQWQQARDLIRLLSVIPCKVNLISFNAIPQSSYQPSDDAAVQRFQKTLIKAGINTRLRKSRGDDIAAACGQLAGNPYINP